MNPADLPAGSKIYVASSKGTYNLSAYDRTLSQIRACFSTGCIVTGAKYLYDNDHDWRTKWPTDREAISGLVLFGDAQGMVGSGVGKEAHNVRKSLKPVWAWLDGTLAYQDRFQLVLVGRPDVEPYAKVTSALPDGSFLNSPPVPPLEYRRPAWRQDRARR